MKRLRELKLRGKSHKDETNKEKREEIMFLYFVKIQKASVKKLKF